VDTVKSLNQVGPQRGVPYGSILQEANLYEATLIGAKLLHTLLSCSEHV
jgi:hypothetical protein